MQSTTCHNVMQEDVTLLSCNATHLSATQVPFNSLGPVYQVLNKHDAQQRTERYTETGGVVIDAEIAEDSFKEMQRDMLDATHGLVKPHMQQHNMDS